ncbi:HAD-like domain-containing protein [Spinellus fusiger]|nr:HAD-like domain-containing protein [Spinellus fusiger]
MSYQAIIFDLGGVCVGSPLAGIAIYEQKHHLPHNYINVAITQQGEQGAFQRLERGEIKLHDFYKLFGEQLSYPSNKQHYVNYLNRYGKAIPAHIPDVVVDGKDLFKTMMRYAATIDERVLLAIQRLKESGRFKIAALTNNFELPENDIKETEELGGKVPDRLRNLFDFFIESRLVGLRKPDPKFFLYACELIDVPPKACVFLDDIGMNLTSAKELGMTTIQVKIGRSEEAIKALEKEVNMDLHSHPQKL